MTFRWCHHWFHRKMMSVKWVQKFCTDDMSIPRSGSAFDWLKQTFSQSDLGYPDLGSERSPVWNFCPHFPDVVFQGNQLWPGEMYAVFSGCYKKGWKWLHEYIFLTVCITSILPLYSGTLPYGYLSNTVTSLLCPFFFAGFTFPYKKNPLMVTR